MPQRSVTSAGLSPALYRSRCASWSFLAATASRSAAAARSGSSSTPTRRGSPCVRLFDHLLPGGVLVIEIETPTVHRRSGVWQGRWWKRDDGAIIVNRQLNRYDAATRVETGLGIYELFEDGVLVETELDEWVCRYWEPDELRAVLDGAGFVDIRATKAYTSLPLDGDETIVSFLAVKPEPARPA